MEWSPEQGQPTALYYEHEDDAGEELWMDDGQDSHATEEAVHYTMEPIYDVDEYGDVFAT